MFCIRERWREGERRRERGGTRGKERQRGESYQSSEGETKGKKLSREASILCRLRAERATGK